MKRLLFIGHEANRTGAPIVLLHYLRWLKANHPEIIIDLMLLRGGEMLAEYATVANVFVLSKFRPSAFLRRAKRHLGKDELSGQALKLPPLQLLFEKYDIVVGNTVLSLDYLRFFKKKGTETICWLHELESVIRVFYSSERFLQLCENANRFVVVSEAGRAMLGRFGVDKPIALVHEFSPIRPQPTDAELNVRKLLGISPEAFLVGGCGTVDLRKGTDIFMQIAQRLAGELDDVYFVWVGDMLDYTDFSQRLMKEHRAGDLQRRLFFTGKQEQPYPYFAAMDIFALTSREDPFPLVCLEAASLGKPIICFADAGGMPEFVGNDAGAVIPYGDVDAFCEKIRYFRKNRAGARAAGAVANAKVNGSFAADVLCKKLYDILTDTATTETR